MKNIEFYYDEISKFRTKFEFHYFALIHGAKIREESVMEDVLKWLKEEHHILDNTERRYLRNIIRPFKAKVKYIVKMPHENDEYIEIRYMEDENCEVINLPSFKYGTMYVGMKGYREYTLDELEL